MTPKESNLARQHAFRARKQSAGLEEVRGLWLPKHLHGAAKAAFDPTGTAAYIRMRDGQVAATREIAQNVLADFDADGNVLGVEVLNVWQP